MADIQATLSGTKQEIDTLKTFFFTLADPVSYIAGQFFKLILSGVEDQRGPSRFFSNAAAPSEHIYQVTTTISQSPFKQALTKLPIGTNVSVQGPFGKFFLTDD